MNVAHVDSGPRWRGGQAQVAALVERLARLGVRQCVIAADPELAARARAAGAEAARWTARGDADLPAAFSLARALRAFAPDVAHLHDARAHALGWLAARLAGVRHVVVSRRVSRAPGRDPGGRLKYALPVDRVLCVSEGVRAELVSAGVPAARLAVVPSGVDVGALRASVGTGPDLRATLGLPGDAEIVGTVAALTREKGHDLLLRAAGEVAAARPGAQFVWIGEGPERRPLEAARDAAGLSNRVHLLGQRDDAPALAAQFTVFALASRFEGLGTAVLEAQALGVPVVATAVGGIPELVADGRTGRLVPPGDARAFAAALCQALTNAHERVEWAAEAGRAVLAWDISRTVDATLAIYREVTGLEA